MQNQPPQPQQVAPVGVAPVVQLHGRSGRSLE
jgi:hypothetical protein